jgi:hypothetical protein
MLFVLRIIGIAVLATAFGALNSLRGSASVHDPLVVAIGKALHSGNSRELRSLRRAASTSPDHCAQVAYDLARFQMANRRDVETFVAQFPDGKDFMCAYAFEPKMITPSLFSPYDWLSDAALGGNALALTKVLRICARGDGAVGELVCDFVSQNARAHPSRVLNALASLSDSMETRIATNPLAWCDSHNAIRKTKPSGNKPKALKAAILRTTGC